MKIVFVSKEYPPSRRSYGIGTYVYETGAALRRAGHQVTVIAASDDAVMSQDRMEGGVRVIRIPDVEANVPGPLTWSALRKSRRLGISYTIRAYQKALKFGIAYRSDVATRLEGLLDQDCADIVEFAGYRGESLLWAKMPRRIPMIVRVHGRTAWMSRSWTTLLSPQQRLVNQWETAELMAADRLSAVAHHLAPALRQRVPAWRVHTIPNGIDTRPWSARSEDGDALTDRDILYVGSLARMKGVFLLIEVAQELRRSGWPGRLVLAGRQGEEYSRYIRRFRNGLPGWISALGHYPRERLASLYATSGVCCLPSYYEGFNYTGLEALASGAILVASSAGTEELIGSGAGYVFPAGDRRALANVLRKVLALGDSDRHAMRQRAMQSVRERFEIGAMAKRTADWYREVLSEFHSTDLRRAELPLHKTAQGVS